jgi:1,4-alpha-glucan branching enzyme
MSDGSFCLVLHTHIPYVLGHGRWPHGHHMICEAAADCYIPLLWEFQGMVAEGLSPKVTLGITPPVMEQLTDERFQAWCVDYLDFLVQTAHWDYEEFRHKGDGHLQHLAWWWEEKFRAVRRFYVEDLGKDLLGAFRALHEDGHIEIIGSAATHGYLPLLREDASILAQIGQGIRTYERHMGSKPRGFWLPECAYRPRCEWGEPPQIRGGSAPTLRPGIEELLAEAGIEYFLVDNHMLSRGDFPLPVDLTRGPAKPGEAGRLFGSIVRRPESDEGRWPKSPQSAYFVGDAFEDHPPIACLARDENVCRKVWSAEVGYPGDPDYLEFHKRKFPGRTRYWRVTERGCDLGDKWPYEPEWAENKAKLHAADFLSMIKSTLHLQTREFRQPVLCATFDTELYGHWWHEGPRFLGWLLRWGQADPSVDVRTVSEYLDASPPTSAIVLPEGSWGKNGTHEVWLNEESTWVWRLIYDAEEDMVALAREWGATEDATLQRLLAQAGRELLLLQSSDFPFLISTKSAEENAAWRINAHYSDFKSVAQLARKYGKHEWITDDEWVYFGELCQRNRIFADHDVSLWRQWMD